MLDFPASPTSGQYYTSSVRSWRYNGTTWILLDDPWLDADSFDGLYSSYFLNLANQTGTLHGLVGQVIAALTGATLEALRDVSYDTELPNDYEFNHLSYNIAGYWEPTNIVSLHTGDNNLHYPQTGISILSAQISNFTESVQDVIGTTIITSDGASGIYDDTANIYTISGVWATSSTRGVASFDSAEFNSVTGNITINQVPYAKLEQFSGPFIVGHTGIPKSSPIPVSPDLISDLLSGYLTTHAAVTGIATSVSTSIVASSVTGFITKSNNLSDIQDYDLARQNLKVRYNIEDFTPLNGSIWSQATLGAGTSYQYDPQYGYPAFREPGVNGIVIMACPSATGASDAVIRYQGTASIWLSTGEQVYFRVAKTFNNEGNIFRFGLMNALNSASGDIINGVYFEFNGSSGSNIIACTASGSTRTKIQTAYSASANEFLWYSIRYLGTGVEYYTDGNNTPIASIYSNYPGRTFLRSMPFFQTCGTGSFRNFWVDKFAYPYVTSSLPSGIYL